MWMTITIRLDTDVDTIYPYFLRGVQKRVHLNTPVESHVYRHKEWQTTKDLATCQLMNLILFSAFCRCDKMEVIYVFANIPYLLTAHRSHKLGGHNCQ